MSDKSAIEWTEATWNPVTGCSKVSPGCANCYAETLSLRYGYSKLPWTPANAEQNVVLHPERLRQPLSWRRPRLIFVNSMSDLFHELVPFEYIDRVFEVMEHAPWHTFQVLTKRPERMREYMVHWGDARATIDGNPAPSANVWLGTSIENDRWVSRADEVRATPAAVRFLSCEPLLGPLPSLDLSRIDWVIVGGESGGGARPMHSEWVRQIREKCSDAGSAFFFKQWGAFSRGSEFRNPWHVLTTDARLWTPDEWFAKAGATYPSPGHMRPEAVRRTGKHGAGRELDGRTWDEMPRTLVPA